MTVYGRHVLDIRASVRSWIGAFMMRRIRKKGIDLSRISVIPEPAKVPLQRLGADPVPEMARMRRADALYKLPMPFDFTVYVASGYSHARAVLTDPKSYSNDIRHLFGGNGPATADDIGGLGFTDPPLHTRLRKIVQPEFTMRRLARLEPMITERVDRLLEEMASAGPQVDLASMLAFKLPFETICDLLGLDYHDRAEFESLGSQRFDATNGAAGAFGAVSAQREFLFDAVARQRREPGPGLIGQIIRDEGDSITDFDLAGLADGVFTGGFETTAGMIALGTMVLLRDHDYARLVREGTDDDIDRVVEELLRYLSVVQVAFPRFAKDDMELFGQHIKKGDVILASLSAANRDPKLAGDHAEKFDPYRIPESGHLAFGHGLHRCLGAELARMELRIVFPRLFRRFPGLELMKPESELNFRQLSFVFGVEELPVLLE